MYPAGNADARAMMVNNVYNAPLSMVTQTIIQGLNEPDVGTGMDMVRPNTGQRSVPARNVTKHTSDDYTTT